jgi:hypothetical protein
LQIVISSTHSLLISNILFWNYSSSNSGKSISSNWRVWRLKNVFVRVKWQWKK